MLNALRCYDAVPARTALAFVRVEHGPGGHDFFRRGFFRRFLPVSKNGALVHTCQTQPEPGTARSTEYSLWKRTLLMSYPERRSVQTWERKNAWYRCP